jgi:predicted RNase H-like HicB family nuclease
MTADVEIRHPATSMVQPSWTMGYNTVIVSLANESVATPIVNIFGNISTQFFMVPSDEIHLSIDSLSFYEVKTPIPVCIECIEDDEFIAEIPEINMAMAGDTIGEAMQLLKEHVQAVFRRYESKKQQLGPEPRSQMNYLEQYIGREK